MSKIAVFLAPGFEEIEALTSVDYLRRAGQEVVTVAVPAEGKKSAERTVVASHGISVVADAVLEDFASECDLALPDAVFFPGGMPGASNLAANAFLRSLVGDMEKAGKLVATMCASPAVFLSRTGILEGRKWTCYPGMDEGINQGTHVAGVPFVLDRQLLTGRGPGTAEQFAMEFVRVMAGADVAKKVHDGSCQR